MRSRFWATAKLLIGFAFVVLAPLQAQFVYVGGELSTHVPGFQIGPAGDLASVSGSPFVTGGEPIGLAVGATGKFLYVANFVPTSVVETYRIEADGALQLLGSAPTGDLPVSVVADPNNRFVYVASWGMNRLNRYRIEADGTLTYLGYTGVGGADEFTAPRSLAMDPAGRFLYGVDSLNGRVFAFGVLSTGDLAPIQRLNLGNALALAVSPTGGFVYVTLDQDPAAIRVFSIQPGGDLTAIGQADIEGLLPSSITTDPTGKFVYAASEFNNKINSFALLADGNLSFLGAVASDVGPVALAVDPAGRFLYSVNNNAVSAFSISPAGSLSLLSGSPFPAAINAAESIAIAAVHTPGVYSSLIGDKDDFHAGDFADVAPKSQKVVDLENALQPNGQGPGVDLDTGGWDRPVGLTHYLALPVNALPTSAKLHFRAKGTASDVSNDGIYYNDTVLSAPNLPAILFRDLIGHQPQFNEIIDVTIDLGRVPVHTKWPWAAFPEEYRSLLSTMLGINQKLNLVFLDDHALDFSELTVTYVTPGAPAGDLNGDGLIDRNDLNMIMGVLNTPAWGTKDPRDLDHDGKITVLDARKVVLLCTKPGCATP